MTGIPADKINTLNMQRLSVVPSLKKQDMSSSLLPMKLTPKPVFNLIERRFDYIRQKSKMVHIMLKKYACTYYITFLPNIYFS